MSLEQTLGDILLELRAIRADLNAPVRQEFITALTDLAHPQPTAPTVQPAPSAPSTAAVSPEQTAPVVLTVSLPDPTSVFGQAALPSVPPATPAAPPTVSPAAQDNLDKNGLPWDGRIHASSKAVVADGSWRMKRGVDPDLVTRVTTELQQTMSAPAGGSLPPWPFATSGADVAPASTFAGLMAVLPGKMVAGELTTDQIAAACASVGVPNLPALAAREDLVPAVAAALGLTQ